MGARRLTLLSCNIQAGNSTSRYREYATRAWSHVFPAGKRGSLDAIAGLTRGYDIVGLQESDPGSLRSGFLNQTHYLAERGGFPWWSHQPNRRVGAIASSANGLLSRFQPVMVEDHPLPGRLGGRGVLLARYGSDGVALTVAVAHLSLTVRSRQSQLAYIAELLADEAHPVLMGDFNCTPDAPEMQHLFRRTRLAPPSEVLPTFPSWAPRRALDHILASEHLVAAPPRALPAARSDHLAVALDLSVPAAALPQPD
jgi:endonuclease/exonuclease/phosphatase family metal-dependent hydrolase